MISHGAFHSYWGTGTLGSGAGFAFVVVGFVVVVIFVALGALVVLSLLDLESGLVGFEFVSLLGDSLSAVPFALPVGFDFGASVAPFTVAVGPAGGAR